MIMRDLALALQYGLPHRFLSRLMYYFMRSKWKWLKDLQISQIAKRYQVDMNDALEPDLKAYPTFNAFFTRALRPGARPIAQSDNGDALVLCPADGAVSQAGPIQSGRVLQAKGMDYSAAELLGDEDLAKHFQNGSFATIYLSPRDYHRVHMPADGTLVRTLHVPGRLFSVATWTAESIPRLFARNERLVCIFDTPNGKMALILVGAIFVSSMDTVWSGTVTPPYAPKIIDKLFADGPKLAAGAEMGRFNMGSTAIVLTERAIEFDADVQALQPVKMGRSLGRLRTTDSGLLGIRSP
jgi:phosphatidylserine decarboxylase